MAKELTPAQMAEAMADGDEFEFDDDGRRSIEGFSELVAELRALVAAQRANAGADMMRSENMEQLVALLQKLVMRPPSQFNSEPLEQILREMNEFTRPLAAYRFDVDRDNRGFMTSVTATPIPPTRH